MAARLRFMLAPPIRRLRLCAFLALAVAFACVQQWAFRHWTLHVASTLDAAASKAPAFGDRCDSCLALCAFSASAPAAETSPSIGIGGELSPVWLPRCKAPRNLRLSFRARAPPILL